MFNEGRRVVVGGKKTNSSSFSSSSSASNSRDQLLEKARQERQDRDTFRKHGQACTRIQSVWRSYRTRYHWQKQEIGSLDNKLATIDTLRTFFLTKQINNKNTNTRTTADNNSNKEERISPIFSPPIRSLMEIVRLCVYTSSPSDINHEKRLLTIGKLLSSSIDKDTPNTTNLVSLLTTGSSKGLETFSAAGTDVGTTNSSPVSPNSVNENDKLSTVPLLSPTAAQYIALMGRYIEQVIQLFTRKYQEQKDYFFISSRTSVVVDSSSSLRTSVVVLEEYSKSDDNLWSLAYRIGDLLTNPHEWNTRMHSSTVTANNVMMEEYYNEIASRLAYRVLQSSSVHELCSVLLYECCATITLGSRSTGGLKSGNDKSITTILQHPIVQLLLTVALRAFNVFPGSTSRSSSSSSTAFYAYHHQRQQRWKNVAQLWASTILVIPSITHTSIIQNVATHWSSEAFQLLMQYCSSVTSTVNNNRSSKLTNRNTFFNNPSTGTVETSSGKSLHPILITYILGNIVDLVHGPSNSYSMDHHTNISMDTHSSSSSSSSSSVISSTSLTDLVYYVQCCNSLLSKTPSIIYALSSSINNAYNHSSSSTNDDMITTNDIVLSSSSSSSSTAAPSRTTDENDDTNENDYSPDLDFEVDIDEAVEEAAERNVDLAVNLARTRYLISIAHALRSGNDITTIKIADLMDHSKSLLPLTSTGISNTGASLGAYAEAGNVSLTNIGVASSRRPLSVSPSTSSVSKTTFSSSSSSKRFNTGRKTLGNTDIAVSLNQLLGSYQYLLLSHPFLHQQLNILKDTRHIGTLVSLLLPNTTMLTPTDKSIPSSSSYLSTTNTVLSHAEVSTSLFSLLYTLHQRLTLAKGLSILSNGNDTLHRGRPSVKTNNLEDPSSYTNVSNKGSIMTDTLMQSLVIDTPTTLTDLSLPTVPPLQRMWYAIITHPQISRFFGDVSSACNEVPNLTAALTLFFDALYYSLSAMDDIQFSNEYINTHTGNKLIHGNLASLTALTNTTSIASLLTVRSLQYLNDVLHFAKTILYRVMWSDKIARDTLLSKRSSTVLELMAGTIRFFNILYDRHSRLSTTKEASSSVSSSSFLTMTDDTDAGEAYKLVHDSSVSSSSSFSSSVYRKGSPWKDEDFLWPGIPSSEITPDVILGLETTDITDESLDTVTGTSVPSSSAAVPSSSSSSNIGESTNRRQPPRSTVSMEEGTVTPSDEEEDTNSSSFALHPSDITNRLLSLRRVRAARLQLVLTSIPEVIPFRTRVELFNALRTKDKAAVMARSNHNPLDWLDGNTSDRLQFTVRRNHMLTDAQAAFQDIADEVPGGTRLKERFYVQFVNNEGMNEAGIDGGGLLKEFIDSVVKDAFAPDKGLFKETSDYYMYPNPAALQDVLHPEASQELRIQKEQKKYGYKGNSTRTTVAARSSSLASSARERSQTTLEAYTFLGQLLGKALYEGILVEPRFAGFVLRKILGRKNTVDDLGSYDSSLYSSLMQIKRMAMDYVRQRGPLRPSNNNSNTDSKLMMMDIPAPSDDDDPVTNLCLTFTVEDEMIDNSNVRLTSPSSTSTSSSSSSRTTSNTATIRVTTNLVPHGDNIPVTSDNIDQFIAYVADYRLNQQIAPQVRAFIKGFRQLIPLSWMRMFNPHELQYLIGGLSEGKIDLNDLRRHTTYNGFDPDHPYIEKFWNVISTFTPNELSKFLSFVTSVPQPPLLGFSTLNPKFGIVRVNISNDNEKLPTASTCFNALKLPVYSNEKVLKEKLLYAISSGAGFELT